MTYSIDDIRGLVKEDRVHRSIYTDPEIFELEMERIFARTWVYVGHDSLVPNPGDFYCVDIARQPVVMVRHTDRQVYVVYNRCGHRGTRVVNQESGNVKRFSCMYHGWTYETNGELAGVPLREDEDEDGFDFTDPAFSMMPLPRVESYEGFVFASLSHDGPDLLTYIGDARAGIDEVIARAPDGVVEMVGGCHRYQYRGNWKHQLDNLVDALHTPASHASTIHPDGNQFSRRPSDEGQQAPFFDEKGEPVIMYLGINAYPYGHSTGETMFPEEQAGGVWDEFREVLLEKYGGDEEKVRDVMKQKLHSVTLFPTFDLLTVQNSVRVIIPQAVDSTEVRIYPMRLKGAPEEVFAEDVHYVGLTHSASSFVQTDDIESFRRVQDGLATQGNDWCLIARGLKREKWNNRGVGYGDRSNEIGNRNVYRNWVNFMSEARPDVHPAPASLTHGLTHRR